MKIIDITVRHYIPDAPDPPALSDEQRAEVNAWLDRMAAEFMAQSCGAAQTRMWVDDSGTIQIEPIDTLAASSGADPAAAPGGTESDCGRARAEPVQCYGVVAYCGN